MKQQNKITKIATKKLKRFFKSLELEFVWMFRSKFNFVRGSTLVQQFDPLVKCCYFRLETSQSLATSLFDWTYCF